MSFLVNDTQILTSDDMRRDVARNVSEIPSNNHGDVARYVSTKDHPCTKYDPLSPNLRSNITIKRVSRIG